MKLYVTDPLSHTSALARVAIELTSQNVETVVLTKAQAFSAEFRAKNVFGTFPLFETKEGTLNESSAIAVYLAELSGKYLGSNPVERALVDQWVSYANTTIAPVTAKVERGIFGSGPITQPEWNDAAKNLKAHVKVINTSLEGKKWLAGNDASLADVVLAVSLQSSFQTVLDGGFRKAMKNVEAWANAVYNLPALQKVLGNVQLCAKPLKPVVTAEKKEEKKKAQAPAPKVEKKKEEKPKDNVESLPPTNFNLFDFKTLFVNHPDKGGKGVDTWYEMLDWEGWSFWHFHYDKYEGEGEKLHVTNNLMNGFLSRAEHTSKYTFARHGVFGEEPNLEIMGVWLLRGQEIPDGLRKEHPQFEYYNSRKLDPRNNKDDDKLVREYMGGKEGDKMGGLVCQTFRWHK